MMWPMYMIELIQIGIDEQKKKTDYFPFSIIADSR